MFWGRLTPRRTIYLGIAAAVVLILGLGYAALAPYSVRNSSVLAATPKVSAMLSSEGSLVAGEQVEITGIHLTDVTSVTFADIEATDVEIVDEDTIVATVPAVHGYQPGTVSVEVFAGSTPVVTSEPLTYSYIPTTAVDRQMEYLFAHWDNYNVAQYGDLNSIGGDCANFVSQSLLARGWSMTDDWYNYDAGEDWADAWGHVPSFDEWLRAHPEYGATTLGLDQRAQAKIGDLVVFDWDGDGVLDHIQVVSSIAVVDGEVKIGMVGHNLDSDYRDLDTVLTVDHPGATGYFWSIP